MGLRGDLACLITLNVRDIQSFGKSALRRWFYQRQLARSLSIYVYVQRFALHVQRCWRHCQQESGLHLLVEISWTEALSEPQG